MNLLAAVAVGTVLAGTTAGVAERTGHLEQVDSVLVALHLHDSGTPGPAGAKRGAAKGHAKPVPVSCKRLPGGIRTQESGGNYQARNDGSGAMGAYQVMPGNVGPWSREVLGYPVSASTWMSHPDIQDRVAVTKLTGLCVRYGPRGAAAAWFSGRPQLANDYTYRGGGAASVGDYVDSVMAHAAGK